MFPKCSVTLAASLLAEWLELHLDFCSNFPVELIAN